MKKIKLIIICIISIILLASCTESENILTFNLENITKIELRDGTTGNSFIITDQDKIQTLIQPFNDNEFIKYKSSKGYGGWKYGLIFYENDNIVAKISSVVSDTINYEGYFYNIKNGEINTDYYDKLFTR